MTPAPKAKEVIKIGRKRNPAPCIAAAMALCPFSCAKAANSTIKMAFLHDKPMVVSNAIWK